MKDHSALPSGLKPDCEDESTVVLQNVRNYLPIDMVSHPKRIASSATPLSPMKITNMGKPPYLRIQYPQFQLSTVGHPRFQLSTVGRGMKKIWKIKEINGS